MSLNKITLTIHSDNVSVKDIQNAVRRFASANVEVPDEGTVEAKGVTLTVQSVKRVPAKSKQDIRAWLAANGNPEVLGKRGRIAKELVAKFEAAHA